MDKRLSSLKNGFGTAVSDIVLIDDFELVHRALDEKVIDILGKYCMLKDMGLADYSAAFPDTEGFAGTKEHPALSPSNPKIHYRRHYYTGGFIDIKRDCNSIKLQAFKAGQQFLEQGCGIEGLREIMKFKIRDRRFDGTDDANICSPLTDWYYNNPLVDKAGQKAIELSLYCRNPYGHIIDIIGHKELNDFVKEPFDFIFGDEEEFARLFTMALGCFNAPGQVAIPLPGVASHFTESAEEIARELGYEKSSIQPSHLNVLRFAEAKGYEMDNIEHTDTIRKIGKRLKTFEEEGLICTDCRRKNRSQKSWILLLQKFQGIHNFPDLAKYYLGGLEFPLYYDGKGTAQNIWLSKRL